DERAVVRDEDSWDRHLTSGRNVLCDKGFVSYHGRFARADTPTRAPPECLRGGGAKVPLQLSSSAYVFCELGECRAPVRSSTPARQKEDEGMAASKRTRILMG